MDPSLLIVSIALIAWLIGELRGQNLQLFFDPNAQLAFWTHHPSPKVATPPLDELQEPESPREARGRAS